MTAPVLKLVRPSLAQPERKRDLSRREAFDTGSLTLGNLRASVADSDRAVAQKALQMALNELGDGVTLVWRRESSQLSGRVKPLFAFRDAGGRICRAVAYTLSRGRTDTETRGTACRAPDGTWTIEG